MAAAFRVVALVAAGVLVAGGCSVFEGSDADGGALEGPSTTLSAAEGVVVVQNISFNPARVAARVGQEVVWTVDDNGVSHSVTADDGSFDSGRLSAGDFKRTFDQPGEVAYHCAVHARMKGTVVVS